MTVGWKTHRLADVAELQGRIGWKGLTAKEYTPDGPYFLSVHSLNYGDYVDFRDAFHISQHRYDESPEIMLRADDVLICKDGAGIGKVGIIDALPGQSTINSSLLLIRAKQNILPKYLYRVLQSPYFQAIVQSRLEGATTPHLYQRDIATFPVHLPPLEEQRRIVAVLDEAFAAIATATANAEKSLASVEELLAAAIHAEFEDSRESWSTRPFEACIGKVKYPAKIQRRDFRSQGQFPVISQEADFINGYWDNPEDVLRVPSPLLVFGDHTRVLKYVDFDFVLGADGVKLLLPQAFLDTRFLLYFLKANPIESKGYARHYRHLKSLDVPVPPLPDQKRIAERLDTLTEVAASLRATTLAKLKLFAELKESLLRCAFTGELTGTMPETIAA